MKLQWIVLSLIVLLVLAGCAAGPERRGAPVSAPGGYPEPGWGDVSPAPDGRSGDGTIAVIPYQAPAHFEGRPSHSSAVNALLRSAEQQESQGKPAEAVATIERALRIEPRNAHLWNRLAHLRLKQQQSAMAADLAAKSNALAAGDVELKRDNWNLIGRALRAEGDVAGAKRAERKARMLY
jgi:tetratricopeptide (TPR) repeat protein